MWHRRKWSAVAIPSKLEPSNLAYHFDQITAKHWTLHSTMFRVPSFLRCSWSILYWFPTGFFLSTHFYHVKTISGRSMQVCSHRSPVLCRSWLLTALKEANTQSQLFSIKRCSCLQSICCAYVRGLRTRWYSNLSVRSVSHSSRQLVI